MRAAYGLKITCFWASHYQVLSLVYCKCACISWNNVYERVDFIIHSSWTLTEWAALSSTLLECHTITDQPLAWILSEFHKLWSCCLLNRVKVFEVKQSSRESSTHHFHCQSPRGFVASAAGFRQGTDNMLNTRDQGQILHSRVTHTLRSSFWAQKTYLEIYAFTNGLFFNQKIHHINQTDSLRE